MEDMNDSEVSVKFTSCRKRRRSESPLTDQADILLHTYDRLKNTYSDISPILLFLERGNVKVLGADVGVVVKELNLDQRWDVVETGSITMAKFSFALLEKNLSILIARGHLVGIVRRNKDVESDGQRGRTFDGFYSRSMYSGLVGIDLKGSHRPLEVASSRSWFNFLMVLHERPAPVTSKGCQTTVSLLAVCASSGTARYAYICAETIHDQQAKLRELVIRVTPVEFILPLVGLSDSTESTINRYVASANSGEERIRVQRFDEALYRASDEDDDHLEMHLRNLCSKGGIPVAVRPCLWAVRHYATLFNMEDVVSLIRLSPIEVSEELAVDQMTTRHLELFRSADTDQYEGSLLWSVANRIRTPFGLRLLKTWFQRALTSSQMAGNRYRCVRYFRYAHCSSTFPEELSPILQGLPDLEAGLACIFYKKCTVFVYVRTIKALIHVREHFKTVVPQLGPYNELPLPADVTTVFQTVIDDLEGVEKLLDNVDGNGKTGLIVRTPSTAFLNTDVHRDVAKVKKGMERTRALLDDLGKEEISPLFGEPLKYGTFDGHDYVVAVPVYLFDQVPKDWCTVWRGPSEMYVRSPTMTRQVASLRRQGGQLEAACQTAWNEFLQLFRVHYHRLRRAVQGVAEIDCLLALANSSREDGLDCRPMIVSLQNEASLFSMRNGHHGVTEKLARLSGQPPLILTNFHIEADRVGCMVLCGGDEATKRFVVKLIGASVVLAQMGGHVQARMVNYSAFAALVVRLVGDVRWTGKEELSSLGLVGSRGGGGNSLVLVDDEYFRWLVRNGGGGLTDDQLSWLRSKVKVVEIVKVGRKVSLKKISATEWLGQFKANG